MVRDGLVFKDENGQVIFNQYSFCELVKHLLVELVGISYEAVSYTHLGKRGKIPFPHFFRRNRVKTDIVSHKAPP